MADEGQNVNLMLSFGDDKKILKKEIIKRNYENVQKHYEGLGPIVAQYQ